MSTVAASIPTQQAAVTPAARANAIRALAMDAVQKANSGHPGMPMGMADIAEALWHRHLKHNPADPRWLDRDRFVISNGHGSMLLYALLHLTGYDLPIDELKKFRQLHSKTPGHPEVGITPGVETTTGPLGQGVANAVGMALAEKLLAAEFNRPGFDIVDHYTYVFLGDGCLMEGISHEACSLAGTLGLGKLIVMYDDNGISIDSAEADMRLWFSDNTPKRFEAYGWQVIADVDGHDAAAIDAAIMVAQKDKARPTLICCKTVIGKGAPNKAGTGHVHGAPLGDKEIAETRKALDWPHAPFVIPDEISKSWDARKRGMFAQAKWEERFEGYRRTFPGLAIELQRRMQGDLSQSALTFLAGLVGGAQEGKDAVATRKASQKVLESLGPVIPELLGGSADLTGSNLTNWKGSQAVTAAAPGNYLHYGVREFGMAALMNGVVLHGGYIPYGGTFLTFSDYARNGLRMAALMKLRSIFVFTHDSIGLGEDGPTHQPIEHAATLRYIPGLDVWRPCDMAETAAAWKFALERNDGPSCLLLSRQSLPVQARAQDMLPLLERGGYILSESEKGNASAIVIATGSEVAIAIAAQKLLQAEGIAVRVVSMPSTSVFDRQPEMYRNQVIAPNLPCIAIEAGIGDFWHKYVGRNGAVLGINRFGESAPAEQLYELFGLTAENIVREAKRLVSRIPGRTNDDADRHIVRSSN
jgi:transketolase